MPYVLAAPEMMTAAAGDLAGIGSALSKAHAAAAAPTVGLVPAAADEVSAGIAHLFSRYAEDFQGLAGRAAAFHEHFAQHLTEAAHSYAGAEAINVANLRWLLENAGVFAASQYLFATLRSENVFFQILQQVLEPIRAILGLSLLLLLLSGAYVFVLLSNFLGQLGL
ncbi:PE family protein [Mycobacterium conspicuum]|jgi:hypothetical protein|uniref:Uncharacterized protein n=1 Tax=Mycobacterium conspicuum TaxID=44010 RepID=A0A1X1TB60_9MYCO|nr:PE family protein [Mycobacterium conspicuum]ORV41749.1 hypothetical protein AWC00_13185 [Mycobacterium conspicuum]BBZ40656.1 hypothetical protein MCNS_37190 [Mycobacterium conspicuum]